MKTYTLRETSQIVGVTVVGLNRMINRGDLVAFQPGGEGSRIVVPADELERLQRRVTGKGSRQ